MLDANLYSLKLVKSAIEPDKTFLINESDGEPVYFRLRSTQEDDSRIELYHSLTMAPLGSYQHISSKLKLIALRNPNSTIELRNTGYLTWEWTFEFERGIKFSWRKNIIGLSSQKRGFSCFLVRKPDPDYPCAIYRPGSSTTPASVQFLDFNIRRIENLTDGRGLEQAILLSLLGFTEAMADYESRKASPSSSPPTSNSAIEPSYRPPQVTRPVTIDYEKPELEANEILVSESSTVSEACNRGLNLFKDPLFLYLFVHAPSPNSFKNAVKIANEIKQTHFKRTKEELYQYLIDDIMIKGNSKADLKNSKPNSLKIYLSRTSLDELLPTQGIQSSRRDSHSTQKTSEQKMNRTNEPARTKTRPPELPPKSEEDTQKWKIWSGISRRASTKTLNTIGDLNSRMYPKPLGRSDVSWTSRRNSQRRRGDPIINEKPRSRRSNRNSIIIKLFPGIYLTKEGQQDEYVVEDEKLKDDVYTNSSEYDDYRNFGEKETVNLEVEKAIEDITTGLTDLDEDKGLLKGSEKKDTLSGDLEEKETPKDIQGGGKTLINQEEIQNLNIEEEKGTLDDIQEEREVKPIDHEIKELAREKTQENISREPSERSSDRKIVLKDEDDKVIEIIVLNEESEKARQKSSLQNRGKCWRASSRVVKGGKRTSSLTYSIDHRDRRRNGFRGDDRGCEEGCGCDETMKRSNRLSAISIVSSSIYNYFKSK